MIDTSRENQQKRNIKKNTSCFEKQLMKWMMKKPWHDAKHKVAHGNKV